MTNRAFRQDLGHAIVVARNSVGWSQRRLATEAGVSPTTLGALERGEADPLTSRAMPAIARALGWAPDAARQLWLEKIDLEELHIWTAMEFRDDYRLRESAGTEAQDHPHIGNDEEIDQLAGEIAELGDADRRVVRDLVRRLRAR